MDLGTSGLEYPNRHIPGKKRVLTFCNNLKMMKLTTKKKQKTGENII